MEENEDNRILYEKIDNMFEAIKRAAGREFLYEIPLHLKRQHESIINLVSL
jgi:hypothetical protein